MESARRPIKIEGYTAEELLSFPDDQLDIFVLSNEPISFRIGSAEILGQFNVSKETLTIELAHVDGGGEGVLPTLWSLAERYASKKALKRIEWRVHAVHCAEPNLKLRRLLELKGFVVERLPTGLSVYHYARNLE